MGRNEWSDDEAMPADERRKRDRKQLAKKKALTLQQQLAKKQNRRAYLQIILEQNKLIADQIDKKVAVLLARKAYIMDELDKAPALLKVAEADCARLNALLKVPKDLDRMVAKAKRLAIRMHEMIAKAKDLEFSPEQLALLKRSTETTSTSGQDK